VTPTSDFEILARESNLNPLKYFEEMKDVDARNSFEGIFKGKDLQLSMPSTYMCRTYLGIPEATGDQNGAYWAVIVGIVAFCKVLSIFFLNRKIVLKQ
jgi:hypothetical protein